MKTKLSILLVIFALAGSSAAYADFVCVATGSGEVYCGKVVHR